MHVINEQLASLTDLDMRNKNTMASAKALHEEILAFQEDICKKLDDIIQNSPLVVAPFREPTNLDSDDPQLDSLPPPMAPVVSIEIFKFGQI
jgi:hypothetical protein